MRPRERTALYYANTEKELKLLRDRDHAMEDVVDVSVLVICYSPGGLLIFFL
jgi:hypothetical protein